MTSTPKQHLWTRSFISLLAVTFIAYANISIFFHFYRYLATLPIAPQDYGLLMGIFSGVSLLVRPVISPWFQADNAKKFIYLGTFLVMASLSAYSLAQGFIGLLLVRCFHGLAFVVLGTALTALIVDRIPENKSAQAFGLLSVVVILPNSVVPPLVPWMEHVFGGFTQVLLFFAVLTVLVLPLVSAAGTPEPGDGAPRVPKPRLTRREIKADLKDRAIILTLSAMFLFYCSHALVFFFLAGFARTIGIPDPGIFLTLSTVGEIGVRLVAGNRFDRMNKTRLTMISLGLVALGYAALPWTTHIWLFNGLGLYLGLGWGILMPVFNGLMFDLSPGKFRAFNTNLGFQMFQAGFFVGPFVGGWVVAAWGFMPLFYLCTGVSLTALILTGMIPKN